jgi:hypothetical protein
MTTTMAAVATFLAAKEVETRPSTLAIVTTARGGNINRSSSTMAPGGADTRAIPIVPAATTEE